MNLPKILLILLYKVYRILVGFRGGNPLSYGSDHDFAYFTIYQLHLTVRASPGSRLHVQAF